MLIGNRATATRLLRVLNARSFREAAPKAQVSASPAVDTDHTTVRSENFATLMDNMKTLREKNERRLVRERNDRQAVGLTSPRRTDDRSNLNADTRRQQLREVSYGGRSQVRPSQERYPQSVGPSRFQSRPEQLRPTYRSPRPTRSSSPRFSAGRSITLPTEEPLVRDLAALLGVPVKRIVSSIRHLGVELPNGKRASQLQPEESISLDVSELIAMDLGFAPVRNDAPSVDITRRKFTEEERGSFPRRPPIVCVMGHVDHGKTTLLDALRKTSVAANEAGGITQHIGAFLVKMASGQEITFLDTPGHAAFEAMRARGAQVTDIVVLVVAADDGVMPQTIEAVKHAQAAGVSIVVAVNKCDSHAAKPRRVREMLLNHGIVCEDFGGDVVSVDISALKGDGLDQLEEAISLQAEMLDLRADTNCNAEAVVVDVRMDKRVGTLISAIVRCGTLKVGDHIVIGTHWGRVRSLLDENNVLLTTATPSRACTIVGLRGVPQAGDEIFVVESEERAREVTDFRADQLQKQAVLSTPVVETPALRGSLGMEATYRTAEYDANGLLISKKEQRRNRFNEMKAKKSEERRQPSTEETESDALKGPPSVPIIIKADVVGSAEAIQHALTSWPTDELEIRVLQTGVGDVTDSDLINAQLSNALVLAFNVKVPPPVAAEFAKKDVQVRSYNIIYRLLEDVREVVSERLPKSSKEVIKAVAEVLSVFPVKKGASLGKIAGCRIKEGVLHRAARVRVLRPTTDLDPPTVLFEGPLSSLKHFKEDVTEVKRGAECGIGMEGFEEFRQGDVIQSIETVQVKRLMKI
mmetsp:Transcript_24898/g.40996  ORF Transcript_24898/g.40996 Transcript_24898/m.40996 type:complete len:809 (-) Transcript_24898:1009-3435(-)